MKAENDRLEQPTVLIVSDDREFSRSVVGRWQAERTVPPFTLMSSDLCRDLAPEAFELAIVGAVHPSVISVVLQALDPSGKPVVFVCDGNQSAQAVREVQPRIMVLRQHEGWLDALVLVAAEALRLCEVMGRAHRAEQANKLLERQATLGRYVLEMRHTLNNALTSVLGNSELLLLDAGSFSATARSQIETIRNMSVRMHEILQRFSSIEKELNVVEKQAERDSSMKSQAAAANL